MLNATLTLFNREMLIFKKNIKTNVIRSVMFPLIFILILGSLGNTPKNVPIAVVNYDNGPLSFNFINQLEAGSTLKVVSATNQQDAMGLLQEGSITAVVVIPNGFSNPTSTSPSILVYVDLSSSTSAEIASSAISSTASRFNVKAVTSNPQGAGLSVSTNVAYGASSNTATFTIAGLLIMVATFGAVFGGGVTLLSDRELGNLKAFLITPINTFAILLSKVMYGTVNSVFSAYVALVIGLLYGASIAAGIGGLLEILWFVFLAGFGFSAIATAIAVRTKQVQTYQLVVQTIVMPLSFLGGALVPVSSLPSFLHPLTVFNPLTYAVNAVRGIMIRGYLPMSVFVTDTAILLVFSVVMLALSAILFKGANE